MDLLMHSNNIIHVWKLWLSLDRRCVIWNPNPIRWQTMPVQPRTLTMKVLFFLPLAFILCNGFESKIFCDDTECRKCSRKISFRTDCLVYIPPMCNFFNVFNCTYHIMRFSPGDRCDIHTCESGSENCFFQNRSANKWILTAFQGRKSYHRTQPLLSIVQPMR